MKASIYAKSFHDIHTFHHHVPSEEILRKLDKTIPDSTMEKLDVIFIPGDFFDRLVYLPNEDVWVVKAWVRKFLKRCKQFNVKVKLLEGTPSHDRKQGIMFTFENKQIGADLYYAQDIELEYDNELGIWILYVPDQMGTPEHVYDRVIKLYQEKGIEQADICLLHGQFDYQFPPFAMISCHNSAMWNKLVKYFTVAGHVHLRSQHGNIYVAGSFDRLKHGEEEPKGHLDIYLTKDNLTVNFIENKEAHLFKSISVEGKSFEEASDTINQFAEPLPSGTFVRVICSPTDAIRESIQTLRKAYPLLKWTILEKDRETTEQRSYELVTDEFSAIEITKDNLLFFVEKELNEKYRDAPLTRIAEVLKLTEEFK